MGTFWKITWLLNKQVEKQSQKLTKRKVVQLNAEVQELQKAVVSYTDDTHVLTLTLVNWHNSTSSVINLPIN